MNWLLDILGITHNSSSRWYTFWTGFVRDVPLVAAAYVFGRKHNCHMKRCFRVGRIPLAGSEYTLCSRHHPGGDTSQAVIDDAIDRRNAALQAAATAPASAAEPATADVP